MKHRSRLGQTLVLGLFFLMPATLFVASVINVSFMIEQRQRLQLSADRAAAAGAVMKADIVSSLAWINLAQADLQSQLASHAVNTAVAGTLAEIEDWGLGGCAAEYPTETNQWSALAGGTQWAPPQAEIAGAGAIARYNTIYATATTEIANAQAWMGRLKSMQANIAALGQELIKREVFRTALANMGVDGDDSVDGLVHINLFPYTVYFAPTGDREESWRITQTSNGGWLLEGSTGRTLEVQITDADEYIILENGSQILKVEFIGTNEIQLNDVLDVTYHPAGSGNLGFPSGSFEYDPPPPEETVHFGTGPNGGMMVVIPSKGVNAEFRTNPFTGELEEYVNGSGWTPMTTQMDLGNIQIPAQSNTITLKSSPGDLNPVTLTLLGGSTIGYNNFRFDMNTGQMWYVGPISPLCNLEVYFPGAMNINGWRVPDDASGQWLIRNGRRERLSFESPGVWVYEIATVGGYTKQDTNFDRFGVDQAQGIFGDYFNNGGASATWLYDGRINGPGWYDLGRGTLAATGLDTDEHYHRTIDCWHPLDAQCPMATHANGMCPGNGNPLMTTQLDGGWHDPLSTAWVTCPLCEGTDADSSGSTDIRRYPESNTQVQNDPIRRSRLRTQGDDTNWDINAPVRLVLTDEFFRWGINVAVHSREYPWDKFVLPNYFTDVVNWSPIATASARVGFVDPDTGQLIIRFDDDIARDAWLDDSWQNLMITDWVAHMVSTRAALRLEDLEIDPAVTFLTNIPTGDSGAVAMLKHYLDYTGDGTTGINQWRHSFDDRNPSGSVSSARQGLSKDGGLWTFQDPNIDAWIKH